MIVLIIAEVLTVGFLWIFQSSLLINVDHKFEELWGNPPLPVKPNTNISQISSIETWVGAEKIPWKPTHYYNYSHIILLQLDCCGNVNYKDYLLAPKSCYNKQTDKLNQEGCRQKFLDYIADSWTTFNIFSLILVGVEVGAMCLNRISMV